jgi:lipopolysaccharide export system permease protein
MLQNKIYQNFLIEIFKIFFAVLFSLSLIALTVRAVSFLDLIVENGYPVAIYFKYSFLNFFGIAPKFIPFSFLLALTIFTIKRSQDSEFIILWTSGVKKIYLVNLFFFSSLLIFTMYLVLSTYLTPQTLYKSRLILSDDKLNSLLPAIKSQKFTDTFKGMTFIVNEKNENEIQDIFIHDKGNNLKNLSPNSEGANSVTIIAKSGLIDNKNLYLLNGQIISSKKKGDKIEVIKFNQLNIVMDDLTTTTIKKPKIQETSTIKMINCFLISQLDKFCNESAKKEMISVLNRRIILPLYIPVISLITSLLLINSKKKYLNKINIFMYSFILLLIIELSVRYTGLNLFVRKIFLFTPFALILLIYTYLIFKFKSHSIK